MKLAEHQDKKYHNCIKRFALKPIRSEAENELAADMCDELLDRFDSLSSGERDYLEVLSTLVEQFESQWQEEKKVKPQELLLFLMEQNGLTQTDLIPQLGTSSRVSEFLSGKRDLSIAQILNLSTRFKMSPAAFLPSTG
jgi:HTH-type transcriptional regulator / antitoxin HigA